MTFRDLQPGQHFKFDHGRMTSFTAICKKISSRRYTWHADDGRELTSKVGTVNVRVAPMTLETRVV